MSSAECKACGRLALHLAFQSRAGSEKRTEGASAGDNGPPRGGGPKTAAKSPSRTGPKPWTL
eukprot:7970172-Heterocapsa_arctica.AAC.1